MFKKVFNPLNILIIILFLLFSLYYFKPVLKEGVIFTPYDNSKVFVRPWEKFCIQTPPSCKKNDNFLLIDRDPEIGCWCNDKQKAPLLDNNCNEFEFDPYIEYRR